MEDRSNQTYTPRVVRARINIPARPWQAYREEYRGQGFTVNNFKAMQKADQYFNGLEITLSSWWYDDHSCWHLFNWPQAVDDRVMCAMYHAEQYKGGPGMLPSAPKSKAELLQAQWERERPRPQRPAAGWMQAAAERANRAQAAVIAKRKEGKPG